MGEFFSVYVSPSAGTTAGVGGVEDVERVRRKSPSLVRRDRQRRVAFLGRRHQEVAAAPSTPTPCMESTTAVSRLGQQMNRLTQEDIETRYITEPMKNSDILYYSIVYVSIQRLKK